MQPTKCYKLSQTMAGLLMIWTSLHWLWVPERIVFKVAGGYVFLTRSRERERERESADISGTACWCSTVLLALHMRCWHPVSTKTSGLYHR